MSNLQNEIYEENKQEMELERLLEREKPALSQLSAFRDKILAGNPEHFGIYDLEDCWEALDRMTLKQYKYLLYLIFNKKYFKAKEILTQLGFKYKLIN